MQDPCAGSNPVQGPAQLGIKTMNAKNTRTFAALTAALLLGGAWGGAQGASHIVDITWSPEGRCVHQAQIAAGKFFEVCGKLAAGQGVR